MSNEPDGVVTKVADGVYDVRYERHYRLPVSRVWAALTEPARLADWLAEARLDLHQGGEIELFWPTQNERMTGKIVEYDPPRVFAFTWPEPDGAPNSLVRFELTELDDGCRLVLTNTLLRAEHLLSVGAGWHAHLDGLSGAAERSEPLAWTDERVMAWRANEKSIADRYRTILPREAIGNSSKN
jgi:uncharacterized protein YndB with AHSA1/START domain